MCPYTFSPRDWASCDGQIIAISVNETLFNLIGTTYGGDGVTTFCLPNLQSRIPIHMGASYVIGQFGGSEAVTVVTNQLPAHSHAVGAAGGNGNEATPNARTWAGSTLGEYSTSASPALQPLAAAAISNTGGNAPHENRMPFQVVNFIICLYGIYPSPT